MNADAPNFPDILTFYHGGMRNGSRIFILAERFRYYSALALITIPAGFPTDGASIPKCFWNIFSPFDQYKIQAAVVHDWLYSPQSLSTFTRKHCDQIFLQAMMDSGVPFVTRQIIYYAVRMFGGNLFKA